MQAALERYTRALHIAERLSTADPATTEYQRDLAASLKKVAAVLESSGEPSAVDYWARAHDTLAALDAAGKLRTSHREFIDYLTRKLSR